MELEAGLGVVIGGSVGGVTVRFKSRGFFIPYTHVYGIKKKKVPAYDDILIWNPQ